MKRATSSVAGRVAIVSGSATCWIRASFMTTIRSAIESASSWLCVTWMNIRPSWRWRLRSSTRMRSWSSRSRSPSGSSSSSAFGLVTSTRASATRCCWPPESARGLRAASSVRPTMSSASIARLRRSSFGSSSIFSPKETLSSTLRCGKSAKCWNTVVVGRLCGGRSTSDCPSRTMSPPVGYSCPPIIRSVVVFPQPDGPEQHDVLAVIDMQVDVVDGDDAAGELLREVDQVEARSLGSEGAAVAAPSVEPTASSVIHAQALRKSFQRLIWKRAVREVGVPRRVGADALRERASVSHRALLDIPDLAGGPPAPGAAARRDPLRAPRAAASGCPPPGRSPRSSASRAGSSSNVCAARVGGVPPVARRARGRWSRRGRRRPRRPSCARRRRPRFDVDFEYGVPDLRSFPMRDWLWAMGVAGRTATAADLGDERPARGRPSCARSLAAYLRRVRGAVADPELRVRLRRVPVRPQPRAPGPARRGRDDGSPSRIPVRSTTTAIAATLRYAGGAGAGRRARDRRGGARRAPPPGSWW